MIVYPAIDIRDGKCVRLFQGDFSKTTVYSEDPIEVALRWESQGAKYLHLVDLDGALAGKPQNLTIIEGIVGKVSIPVQVGGGIRSIDTGSLLLGLGVSRIIMGTSAVKSPEILEEAVKQFGNKLAVGVDARNKRVAVEGWEKSSEQLSVDFVKQLEKIGVKTVIYTDISKDGTLLGPDIDGTKELVSAVGIDIIASGGIGSVQDLIKLKEIGVSGTIVGKALYSGNVSIREILERCT